MPRWAHRTTFAVLTSVAEADLPEPVANYVEEPDLSSVAGQPSKYWLLSGDLFSLADQAARDAVDAALLVQRRDNIADQIDLAESYARAFALVVLDEINVLRTTAGLSVRTAAQLKTALRARLDT